MAAGHSTEKAHYFIVAMKDLDRAEVPQPLLAAKLMVFITYGNAAWLLEHWSNVQCSPESLLQGRQLLAIPQFPHLGRGLNPSISL